VKGFPTEYGKTGFREESDFTLRCLAKGYKLWTDPRAIAWHVRCGSGGVRTPEYNMLVRICDEVFQEKMMRLFKRRRKVLEYT